MIVKRCRCWTGSVVCNEWFESKVGSHIDYCPKHFTEKEKYNRIQRIKHQRYISLESLDIYDTQYPLIGKRYPYEMVCRLCGARLLYKNKNKHSPGKRYCGHPCKGEDLYDKFSWDTKRWRVISKRGSICEICGFKNDKINPYAYFGDPSDYDNWERKNHRSFHVHHIVPVHTLTWDNLNLIWEDSNLLVLCDKCHHKQDHQLKRKRKGRIMKDPNYKPLEFFLKKK